MSMYKMSATNIVTTDAIQSLDVREDGHIIAIGGYVVASGVDAQNEGAEIELSFASVSGFGANDTLNQIFGMTSGAHSVTTSGGSPGGQNCWVSGLRIPITAGERIYMHIIVRGTLTALRTNVWIMVEDGVSVRPVRRR